MKKIIINKNATINLALKQLKFSGTKCLVVLDKNKKLLGTLTDGDLRSKIKKNTKGKIKKIFNTKPYVVFQEEINKNKKN